MKIENLYPEICNYYGDPQNVSYLRQCYPDCEIINTCLKDEPYFVSNDDVDLIYLGSLADDHVSLLITYLKPYTQRIRELIDRNVFFLITGNAVDILGSHIITDGNRMEALGLYDFTVEKNMSVRHNSMFVGKYQNIDVIGYKTTFSHLRGNIVNPLFDITLGIGNNDESSHEGIHDHNLFASYLTGPLLVLNPLFTERLILSINKGGQVAFRKQAMENYEFHLKELTTPGAHVELGEHGF